MSGYRDSYFQYHHLLESHQVLYNEWNQDEFPPPDEQEVNHNYSSNINDEENGSSRPEETGESAPKTGKVSGNSNNIYWDYFHDEEDWNLFKNVQLESNGIATFNQPTNRGVNSANDDANLGENTRSITGSIFNHRITKQAIKHNNDWNDLSLPKP
ncbi:hypothetical protein ZYGM_003643 [Zygosaccharomyces mellis]|uniref:Uncharacterized protein n=1 Tax=Zygosaccharomyces mellis TaxID=42258 RepID=A0A4C2E6X8_9SACH|nr:hypothetical protein ZYGM_003643 [Zygosaccharomyces mellis]